MEILVLGVVAGMSLLSYALWRNSRGEGLRRALVEERAEARLRAEPSLDSLRVGDVVSHLRSDYLVDGVYRFDDDGRVTHLYRLADGARVRWLAVRPGPAEPLLLDEVSDLGVPVERAAPDQIVRAGASYRIVARAQARVSYTGAPPAPPTDRAWVYEYAAAGPRRLLAIGWPARGVAYEGAELPASLLDILPGR